MGSCDKVFGYVMKVSLYFEKGLMGELVIVILKFFFDDDYKYIGNIVFVENFIWFGDILDFYFYIFGYFFKCCEDDEISY